MRTANRKHLTGLEVERLLEVTRGDRNEARDRCLLLLMFRHGLRVSEACHLRLEQVYANSRVLHVRRLKRGLSTDQPLRADELRAIAAWLKERARMKVSATVKTFFISERRRLLHRSSVNLLSAKYSAAAGLPLQAHPHILRHVRGFALAHTDTRLIQDYLGHRCIAHTVRYTASNPAIPAALVIISPTEPLDHRTLARFPVPNGGQQCVVDCQQVSQLDTQMSRSALYFNLNAALAPRPEGASFAHEAKNSRQKFHWEAVCFVTALAVLSSELGAGER